MSLPLKSAEYLFLSAFVFSSIVSFFIPNNQVLAIWMAAFLASWIFLFLINRQVSNNTRLLSNQSDITQKAELYSYLLSDDNSAENNMLTLSRERALKYCQELIDDYKKTRGTSRNIYYIFQLATVILSGVTPILVLVDKLEAGQAWLKWLPVICPAVASIVASIVTSFPFQKNWITANTAVELLEAEQEKFVLGVTADYRCYDLVEEPQRQQKAKQAIENFITQVNNIHLKQVQGSGEKPFKEEKTEQTPSSESTQG